MSTDSRRRFILFAILATVIVILTTAVFVRYFAKVESSNGYGAAVSDPVVTEHGSQFKDLSLGEPGLPLWQADQPNASGPMPRNIILMLGDGMGLGQISTTSSLLNGPAGGLALEEAEVVGLFRVWTSDGFVVDSAAAGTAIATGFRTEKKRVGMLPDGRSVRNLFEAARGHGMATAIITTSYLMDATPSCFSAHVSRRSHYTDILDQMLESGTDVFIGGSSKIPGDGEHSLDRQLAKASDLGFTVVRTEEEMAAANGRILGLFPSRNGNASYHGPPLAVSTRKMLDLLSRHPGGFTALIETEITDEEGHSNDITALTEGVREFDAAIRVALDFAEEHGDTLVLVFADHSTGVPAIVAGPHGATEAGVEWLTTHHTAHWLPLFAFGPGSSSFGGVFDQTQIGPTLAALLGIEGYPAVISD